MKRKRLTILVVIFLLAEGAALFIGFWPMFFKNRPVVRRVLRIGIVPEISVKRSIDEWDVFFKRFEDEKTFRIQPYFAASGEEAIDGLKYGSLDMLYTNAGVFLMLKKTLNAKVIAYQRLNEEEKDKNRSVLIASSEFRFLPQLQGKRLTLTEKNSLSGAMIPSHYLIRKLQMPLKTFFPTIFYSISHKNSIEMLKAGKTDVIAINLLKYILMAKDFPELEGDFNIVWMSHSLPPALICVAPNNPLVNSSVLSDFEKALFRIESERRSNLNMGSKVFVPVDFEYKKELDELEKFFDEYKDNKVSDNQNKKP